MGQFTITSVDQTVDLDVTNLPVKYPLRGNRGTGVFLMFFSLFWGGLPTVFLFRFIAQGNFHPLMLVMLVFTILGTALFLFGLNQFFMRGMITITSDSVTLNRSGLFGYTQWNEYLTNYEGLLYRSEHHHRNKGPDYTLSIIELYHNNPRKNIRLFESRSPEGVRHKWENYCRALNMAALERADEGIVKRQVEDLDKSIQQLGKEEKIHVEDVSLDNPPKGITVVSENDVTEITINRKPPAAQSIMGMFLISILPLVFIYVGFFVKGAPVIFGIAGMFFELIIAAVFVWSLVSIPKLRIDANTVQLLFLTPWGILRREHLIKTGIEQVLIKADENTNAANKSVVMKSDSGEIKFGEVGLTDKELQWLKNCIIKILL